MSTTLGTVEYDTIDSPRTAREARKSPEDMRAYHDARKSLTADMQRRGGYATEHRPFIAWDSEGYSLPDGSHHMMLWGNSRGMFVEGESLGTLRCFDLLMRTERKYPDSFHVIFAGNYDINMMLRDMPLEHLLVLRSEGRTNWAGYRIEYRKTKWFKLTKGGLTVTLYDVFTFFACSFVKALEEYLGRDTPDVQRIREGKERRDTFGLADLPYVKTYWKLELRNLVALCERLRAYLLSAGIRVSKWHGPGAVASAVLRQRGIRHIDLPERVSVAAQYAYAGGRFEAFKIGIHNGPAFQYDIRSAYPYAISQLPSLGNAWHHTRRIDRADIRDFSLYRVAVQAPVNEIAAHIGPFPWRRRNGMVYFPAEHGGGWVWGRELHAALQSPWADAIEITEAWLYDDTGERPFSWIADMYAERAAWKAEGNPAQLALKLAMNSIYGKLAQQVGSRFDTDSGLWILPTFHQLEYAGYITAFTRATLLQAIMSHPTTVIACETDAVFTTTPLTGLTIGTALGQWEASQYIGLSYLQSGLYFVKDSSNEWKAKTRGFTRNRLDYSRVRDYLATISGYDSGSRPLEVDERRFRAMGTSLGKDDWRRWVDEKRSITVGMPGGKREHYAPACGLCVRHGRAVPYSYGLHDTVPALWESSNSVNALNYARESTRYPLVWKGDPPSEYVPDDDYAEEWEVYQ